MLVCPCYEAQVTGGTHFTLCPQPLWLCLPMYSATQEDRALGCYCTVQARLV